MGWGRGVQAEVEVGVGTVSLIPWMHAGSAQVGAGWLAQLRASQPTALRPHCWIPGSKRRPTCVPQLVVHSREQRVLKRDASPAQPAGRRPGVATCNQRKRAQDGAKQGCTCLHLEQLSRPAQSKICSATTRQGIHSHRPPPEVLLAVGHQRVQRVGTRAGHDLLTQRLRSAVGAAGRRGGGCRYGCGVEGDRCRGGGRQRRKGTKRACTPRRAVTAGP